MVYKIRETHFCVSPLPQNEYLKLPSTSFTRISTVFIRIAYGVTSFPLSITVIVFMCAFFNWFFWLYMRRWSGFVWRLYRIMNRRFNWYRIRIFNDYYSFRPMTWGNKSNAPG